MTRVGNSIRWLALSMVPAILLAAGCGKSSSGPSGGPVVAQPTPEQSFDLIVATFKRRIEDTPSGFVTHQASGRSRLMASNKVTSQVLPPAKEGDPYRAEVIVVSETRYSLQRAAEESGESSEKSGERNDQRSGSGALDNPADTGTNVGIPDPGLVTSSGGEGQSRSAPPGAADAGPIRRNDEDKRKFELEYKDGRWTLLTKPDPETERAIELAFQEALSSQI